MNLREYLRLDFHKYIRNKIIKGACEVCNSKEDLRLHHVDKFFNLLMETLNELNLCELDTDNYSEEELKNIKYYMLAKQIKSEYKTLCKKCHNRLHFKESKSEEYKKYYYNPYGNYIFVNINLLRNKSLNNSELCHYIFICTFLKYNSNKLSIKISSNRYRNLLEDDLINMISLEKRGYYKLKKVLLEENLININSNYIEINKEIIKKGNLYNKDEYVKIFIDDYREIYSKFNNRELKKLGNLIKISNAMDNKNIINTEINKNIFNVDPSNFSKYMNEVNKHTEDKILKRVKKNIYIINPRFIYNGDFTMEFKKIIDFYNKCQI